MKKNVKTSLAWALTLLMLLGMLPAAALAAETPAELTATAVAEDIQKYGNVGLSLTCEEIKAAGYAYGDVLTVSFLNETLELPLCSNYSDVDTGSPAVFARPEDTNVVLAINMGDFAATYGLAVKTNLEDKTFVWNWAEGVEGPVTFTLALKEAGGYYDQYLLHQLVYTDAREDFPDLSDEQFANFRAVETTGMGEGVLYRTSSPINPKNAGRYPYADAALRAHGVTVVMNLADDEATARGYEGFDESYYSTVNFIALNMGVDFASEDFRQKLAEGLTFLAEHPGVYAIHCTEGKDRAGFVTAVVECLMGASFDEVIADYMTTFFNYYGVTPEDARYETIARSNIIKSLSMAFGTDDLASADLAACAEQYVLSIGLSEETLAALKQNLSARPAEEPAAQPELPEYEARDTEFFTPGYHTELNYDEIEYEPFDTAAFMEEVAALNALSADAANAPEFEERFLALADDMMHGVAMFYMLQNRIYADAADAWAAEEYQRAYADLLPAQDAFNALVRDALSSPCGEVLRSRMTEDVLANYLEYEDMTDELMALETKEQVLILEYQSEVVVPDSVEVDGVEYTDDSAIEAYMNGEIDSDRYTEISRAIAKIANARLGPILLEMIGVRNQIAAARGYDSYAAYAYKKIYSRDYTPEEAQEFCDAVKEYIIPAGKAYDYLDPGIDPGEMPADVVYTGVGMFGTLFPYFAELSDELLESAMYTYTHKAYDVDPAPNKTGTAYSSLIPYYQIPFYFNNAEGSYHDLTTTIHELGHNNEAYWHNEDWSTSPLSYDTAEVHSQGLETLMFRFYPELFGTQADGVEHFTLSDLVNNAIVRGCLFDEFQRWAYAEPELTLDKLNAQYRVLAGDYGVVDASDERTEMYGWYEIPHNFTSPMYYISYATSAAGALMFWEKSQDDYFAAVDDYLRFTALPRSLGFSEAFEAVGMESPMSAEAVKALAQTIHDRLLLVEPYADVYADDWFGFAVIFVDAYGLMNGVHTDEFAPGGDATREQGMTILARMMDEREDAEAIYTLDEGVAWAVENGISDGRSRKSTLTREQFVTMLYRMADMIDYAYEAEEDLSAFADADSVSDWAVPAMRWAVESGIIEGMGDGTLAPQGKVTRAQIAEIIMRFCLA